MLLLSKRIPVIPAVGLWAAFTVTVQKAVLPFEVVTVIVAVPVPTATNSPPYTLTTFSSLVLQLKTRFVVLLGLIVACMAAVSPTFNVISVGASSTLVASTIAAWTIIEHEAVFPFAVVATITASPVDFASMRPFSSTEAIKLLELLHTMLLLAVLSGNTVAIKEWASPTVIVRLLVLKTISAA